MKKYIEKGVAVTIWGISVYLWFFSGFWYLFAGVLLIHGAELVFKSWKIGRDAGYSVFSTISMTLIFGITWWKYVE